MRSRKWSFLLLAVVAMATTVRCGSGESRETAKPDAGKSREGSAGRGRPGEPPGETAAVPVEVAVASLRSVASYIETNGALEAESEVDIVARTAGHVVALVAEEGMRVRQGQLLLRIDPEQTQAQVRIAEVAAEEAGRSFDRARAAFEAQLISQADYDQALAARDSAAATLTERRLQLAYTNVKAPFDGVVVERSVKRADNLTVNQKLFRISDFDPLLCKIQVPEKELSRLRKGQPAYLEVQAWPGERFAAQVLRVSPVVETATGTIRVTLAVDGEGRLRPGMFASVYLEVERHEEALAIPKRALSLESLGDTVYVVSGGVAARRPVKLGFEEADIVEVLSGLERGDRVIVVGQDGLSDGTPITILEASVPSRPRS